MEHEMCAEQLSAEKRKCGEAKRQLHLINEKHRKLKEKIEANE